MSCPRCPATITTALGVVCALPRTAWPKAQVIHPCSTVPAVPVC